MTFTTTGDLTVADVAKMIDHSLLRPELTETDVRAGCALAARYNVASVCVRLADVPLAADLLKGTDVLVGTVVGFPHGSSATEIKAAEAHLALQQGARELDMVINIGALRSHNDADVQRDIEAVTALASDTVPVKVILETAYTE
ncbi:deoxyribose-phosphate aldolase [Nonomuraea sp. NPDC026600]|uniref:deoxyribose-phosphate aldolase n=1 Tax=Nonomuraea sp. NPDC026600 TaxID=3155363 RepID=UPI0033DB8119